MHATPRSQENRSPRVGEIPRPLPPNPVTGHSSLAVVWQEFGGSINCNCQKVTTVAGGGAWAVLPNVRLARCPSITIDRKLGICMSLSRTRQATYYHIRCRSFCPSHPTNMSRPRCHGVCTSYMCWVRHGSQVGHCPSPRLTLSNRPILKPCSNLPVHQIPFCLVHPSWWSNSTPD